MNKREYMRTEKQLKNLNPIKTLSKEVAKKRGQLGGIAAGKAKKEKKVLSQIFGDFLATKHKINIDDKNIVLTGEEFFFEVITAILTRGDSSSVSMMKEIREATEGNKGILNDSIETENPTAGMTYEEKKAKLEEFINRRRSNYTYAERTAEIEFLVKEREENCRKMGT